MSESMPNHNGSIPITSGRMVRFAANVPIEIALQCVDGVRVDGRYGDRVKYTLTDDRTMYVDSSVAERIRELEIQPGEVFQLCKRQAKKSNRKTIYWTVERGSDHETQLERDLRDSIAHVTNLGHASRSVPLRSPITFQALRVPSSCPLDEIERLQPDNGTSNGRQGRKRFKRNSSLVLPCPRWVILRQNLPTPS